MRVPGLNPTIGARSELRTLGTPPRYQAASDLQVANWQGKLLMSGEWGCPFNNGSRLAVVQPSIRWKKEISCHLTLSIPFENTRKPLVLKWVFKTFKTRTENFYGTPDVLVINLSSIFFSERTEEEVGGGGRGVWRIQNCHFMKFTFTT